MYVDKTLTQDPGKCTRPRITGAISFGDKHNGQTLAAACDWRRGSLEVSASDVIGRDFTWSANHVATILELMQSMNGSLLIIRNAALADASKAMPSANLQELRQLVLNYFKDAKETRVRILVSTRGAHISMIVRVCRNAEARQRNRHDHIIGSRLEAETIDRAWVETSRRFAGL